MLSEGGTRQDPLRTITRMVRSSSFGLVVNGREEIVHDVPANTTLLQWFRATVNACITLLPMVAGREIVTVEGGSSLAVAATPRASAIVKNTGPPPRAHGRRSPGWPT